MRIRHLSTEELLLQCEGELGFERATHLDECEACRSALVHMVELLGEAQQELRATVPVETAAEHAAAWESLEQRISGPATVVAFPMRWAAAYAAAAALGFAVLGGVVGNDLFGPEALPEQAAVAEVEAPEPPEPVLVSPPKAIEPRVVASEVVRAPLISMDEPVLEGPSRVEPEMPVRAAAEVPRQALERYQLSWVVANAVPARGPLRFSQAPAVAGLRIDPVDLELGAGPLIATAPGPQRLESEPLALAVAQAVVQGHWILHRAKVWREDIVPVWTEGGLVFRGTVENERAREAVSAAIRSAQKGRDTPLELLVRNMPVNTTVAPAVSRENLGVPGGLVRTSLLEHFNDAARRSFVSTERSALEGELDRFANNVFESQSSLLSHAYKLNGLLHAVPAELAPRVLASSRYGELVSIHANEIRRERSRIYDLLSEALPRKYWSYKAREGDVFSSSLPAEAEALLRSALELDANLTALLSTPRHLLDAGDADISCGEALSRIRTRLSRIKTHTAKLR